MLTIEDLRFACDDARKRHTAVVDLITATDRQAMALLQVYLTIAIAVVSAATVIYFATPATPIPKVFFAVLIGLAVPTLCGVFCCILSMWPGDISLPGRDASFWLWAMEPGVEAEKAYREYLENLAKGHARNKALNAKASAWLERAKVCGALAPFCALVALFIGIAARL